MDTTSCLAPEAVEDLGNLKANVRAAVRTAVGQHLRHQPKKVSQSRVKRLRGFARPQYSASSQRRHSGVYDVAEKEVQVLAIVPKAEAWLTKHGETDETSGPV